MSYWSRSGVVSLEAFDVTTVAKDAYSFHSSYKIPKRKHIPDPLMEHIPDPVMEQSSIATSPEQHGLSNRSTRFCLSLKKMRAKKEIATNAGCSGRMILLISSVPMQMVFYLLHHMALYIESKRQRRQSMRSGMSSIN